jgi:RNase H-like domain found in reverse transcriptase/Reverse transcriptase (RNA-dependent DNA polymerase)/Integrase core domain/Integrase zinc binding domain
MATESGATKKIEKKATQSSASDTFRLPPPKPLVVVDDAMDKKWAKWLKNFRWWAIAVKFDELPPEEKTAIFMTTIGTEIDEIYESFNLSDEEENDMEIVVKKFAEYFTPPSNLDYEMFLFDSLKQHPDEKANEFIARIKNQVDKCELGALRDRFIKHRIISGTKDKDLQKRLLTSKDLDLAAAEKMCRLTETAAAQLKKMNMEDKPTIVDAVRDPAATEAKPKEYDCKRCGTRHIFRNCPAFKKRCEKCNRMGHVAAVCRSRVKVAAITNDRESFEEDNSDCEFLHVITEPSLNVETVVDKKSGRQAVNWERPTSTKIKDEDDWKEPIQIGGEKILFKLDTGAQCNVISSQLCHRLRLPITKCPTKNIISYSEHRISVVGQVTTKCLVRGIQHELSFRVVEENFPPILGRKSCASTKLIERVQSVEDDVFSGLGCLKDFEYNLDLVENPVFDIKPARRVPYAIKEKVKLEIENMVKYGVIKRQHDPTPSVSPMMVVKKNNKIRICIDPTQLNKNIKRRQYPLKTVEEISSSVSGSKYFTLLDCKRGFWQIKIAEESQKFLTFSTPWGRYSCCRLPFGLCSAPEVFQKVMIDLLGDIEGVEVSMDDILIFTKTESKTEHEKLTNKVISRLKDAGLKLNKEKCVFTVARIKFLGHTFTDAGLEPDEEKIEAMRLLKQPRNKLELQRILGVVNYLGKFIKNLAELTDPLRELIKQKNEWVWTQIQEEAFQKLKRAIITAPVLRFFDVKADVTLQVDASSKAIGAVLMQDGQPVAYAAKSLSKSQTNYPQIEKEALAVRFGCLKFHEYIYGKSPITIETDHKPLVNIFKKSLEDAPARLRRIMHDVLLYNPEVKFKKGSELYIADILSRDCDVPVDSENNELEVLLVFDMTDEIRVKILNETAADDELQQLSRILQNTWPDSLNQVPKSLKKYFTFREELAVYDGLLFKGDRVIIPETMKSYALKMAHVGHPGVQQSLRRAKDTMYWYNMTNDIIYHHQRCQVCQNMQAAKIQEPLINRPIPKSQYDVVASDLFTIDNANYLLIVDSFSGFYEFARLQETTSAAVINQLKQWFSVQGPPRELHSDNGPQYASAEFRKFASEWNFTHLTSSPHHPRSNGLAERYVQVAKNLLKRCKQDNSDIHLALLMQRNTPTETLPSPAERLLNRRPRTPLTFVEKKSSNLEKKDISAQIESNRASQKRYADRHSKQQAEFAPSESVLLQNGPREWFSAKVIDKHSSPRSYIVKSEDGKIYRRNSKNIRKSYTTVHKPLSTPDTTDTTEHNRSSAPIIPTQATPATPLTSPPAIQRSRNNEDSPQYAARNAETSIPELRTTRSGRVIKPVVRLDL